MEEIFKCTYSLCPPGKENRLTYPEKKKKKMMPGSCRIVLNPVSSC